MSEQNELPTATFIVMDEENLATHRFEECGWG